MELAELGAMVDKFNVLYRERLAADKVAAALKKTENGLKERIIAILIDQEVHFAAGKDVRVKLQTSTKAVAENWGDVYEYMIANDAMDLVQKRLHEGAIKARVEEGIVIPGIEFIEVNKLSIGKL
tara:strand:+ start:1216 stop:1590 length:375 start_codon:yes stop_codon:yes gene_type:complete